MRLIIGLTDGKRIMGPIADELTEVVEGDGEEAVGALVRFLKKEGF